MERIDQRILGVYFDDSRISLNTLAKQLKIPKSTVSYRIKRLEQEGVISRYIPIFNYPLLGRSHAYVILMKVKHPKDGDLQTVLNADQGMINSMSYAGAWDIVCLDLRQDPNVQQAISRISKAFGDRLVAIECHKIELMTFYPLKIFETARRKDSIAVLDFTQQPNPEVSALDKAILESLAKDGNMTVLDIAKKVKRAPSVVLNRFRKIMQEGWIQQCRPLLRLEQLIWAVKCTVACPSESVLGKVNSFCQENRYVNSTTRIAGGSTIFIYFLCLDMTQFEEAFSDFKQALGEHMSHVDLLYYKKEVLRDILPM